MDYRDVLYQTRRHVVLSERAKTWQQRIADRKAVVDRVNAIMRELDLLPIADIRRCDPRIYFA